MPRLPRVSNPLKRTPELLEALAQIVDPRPMISDAYWSVTHPVDRIMGRGRAANPQLAYPLAGRYSPRTPGLRAESLQRGDKMIDFEGDLTRAHITPSSRAYNLRNEQGEIVASGDRMRYLDPESKGKAYVPSVWVREDYRKSPAFFDLWNLLSRGGKTELRGTFENERLAKLLDRRLSRKEKTPFGNEVDVSGSLADVPSAVTPEVISQFGARGGSAGGLLGRRLAQHDPLDAAALVERGSVPKVPDIPPEAFAMRRQVTNRDVPSLRQMAPVRRAPAPRPVVDPIVARAQNAQEQIALRHALQAARVSEIQRSVAALRRRGGR